MCCSCRDRENRGGQKQDTWLRVILRAKEMGQPSECTGEPRTLRQKRVCVSERKRVGGAGESGVRTVCKRKDQLSGMNHENSLVLKHNEDRDTGDEGRGGFRS